MSDLTASKIALGTLVLLTGVVCLSWRLHSDDSSTRPPVAQTPLTPGLGLVPSSPTTASSADLSDEEAYLLPPSARAPRRAVTLPSHLLSSGRFSPPATAPARHYGATEAPQNGHAAPSPAATTPGVRWGASGKRSRQERRRRAQTIAEADAIWGELEEDAGPSHSPLVSPVVDAKKRRQSSHSLHRPRRTARHVRSSSDGANDIAGKDDGADNSDCEPADDADEEEARLLAPLGRRYRERKSWGKRRRSETGAAATSGSRGRSGSQSATGGWWKMRRWWNGGGEWERRDGAGGHGEA